MLFSERPTISKEWKKVRYFLSQVLMILSSDIQFCITCRDTGYQFGECIICGKGHCMRDLPDHPGEGGCISFTAWCQLGYTNPSKSFYCLDCVHKMGIAFPPELQLKTNNFRRLSPPRVLQPLAITGIKFINFPATSATETITATLMLHYKSLGGLFVSYISLISIDTF